MAAKEQAFDGRRIVLYIAAVLMVLLGVFAVDAMKKSETVITVQNEVVDDFARRSSSDDAAGDDFQDDTTISMTGLI